MPNTYLTRDDVLRASLREFSYTPDVTSLQEYTPEHIYKSYDYGVPVGVLTSGGLDEYRAQKQGGFTKIGNDLFKMGTLAATTFVNSTLGWVVGLPFMAAELTGMWNNPITNAMLDIQEWSEKVAPNFYTAKEMEMPWYRKMLPGSGGAVNFWADGLLKNFGFVIGAVAAGALTGRIAGSVMGSTNIARNVAKGLVEKAYAGTIEDAIAGLKSGKININKLTDELLRDAKSLRSRDLAQRWVGTMAATTGEASLEAGMNSRQYRGILLKEASERYGVSPDDLPQDVLDDIESQVAAMGNMDFILNYPILLASHFAQFNKAFGGGYRLQNRFNKFIKRSAAGGYKPVSGAGKILEPIKSVPKALKRPIWEGTEEGLQYTAQTAAMDFNGKKYDESVNKTLISFIKSIGYGLSETFGTNAGQENIVLGFLTGALGVPTVNARGRLTWAGGVWDDVRETKSKRAAAGKLITVLNQGGERLKQGYYNTTRSLSYEKDKEDALKTDDVHNFKNAESDQFIGDVISYIDAGKYEDFIDFLDESKNTDPNVLRETLKVRVDENNKPVAADDQESLFKGWTGEEISDYVNKRVDLLKKRAGRVRDIKEALETKLAGRATPDTIAILTYLGATMDNVSERIESILLHLPDNVKLSVSPVVDKLVAKQEITRDDLKEVNQQIENYKRDWEEELKKWRVSPNDNTLKAAQLSEDVMDLLELVHRRASFVSLYREAMEKGNIRKITQLIHDTEAKAKKEEVEKATVDYVDKSILKSKDTADTNEYTLRKSGDKNLLQWIDKSGEGHSKEVPLSELENYDIVQKGKSFQEDLEESFSKNIDILKKQRVAVQNELESERGLLEGGSKERIEELEKAIIKIDKTIKELADKLHSVGRISDTSNIGDNLEQDGQSIEGNPPTEVIDDATGKIKVFSDSPKRFYQIVFKRASGRHYDGDRLTPKVHQIRYFQFTENNNIAPGMYQFMVVQHTNPLIAPYLTDEDRREIEKSGTVGLFGIVTDKATKRYVDAEGNLFDTIDNGADVVDGKLVVRNKIIFTALPTSNLSTEGYGDKMYFPKGVEAGFYDEDGNETPFMEEEKKRLVREYEAFRSRIIEATKNNESTTIDILYKSKGIPVEEGNIDISNPHSVAGTLAPTIDDIDVMVAVDNVIVFPGGDISIARPGFVYGRVESTGNIFQLYPAKLRPEDIEKVIDLFRLTGKQGSHTLKSSTGETITLFNALSNIIYWGGRFKLSNREGAIWLSGGDTMLNIVENGETVSTPLFQEGNLTPDAEALLRRYLSERYYQVNRNPIEDNLNITNVTKVNLEQGTVDMEDVPYKEYILRGEYPILGTVSDPLGTTMDTMVETKDGVVSAEVRAPKLKNVNLNYEFSNIEEDKDDTRRIMESFMLGEDAKDDLADIYDAPEEFERKVTPVFEGFEDIESAEKWFYSVLPRTVDFHKVVHLVNNRSYGAFRDAAVYIFTHAEVGTTYHEAWHVVTQLFLTKEERSALYEEYRIKNNKFELSDRQVEEMLAEDFRDVMLGREVSYLNQPIKESFFKKLYRLIKEFIFGKKDTISDVFNKLRSGYYANKSAVVSKSDETFYRGAEFHNQMGSLLHYLVTDYFVKNNKLHDILFSKSVITSDVYDYVKEQLNEHLRITNYKINDPKYSKHKERLQSISDNVKHVIDNFDTDARLALERYLFQLKIDVPEESNFTREGKDSLQYRNTLEFSGKLTATTSIRLLIAGLPSVRGFTAGVPILNRNELFGLHYNADYDETFNFLSNLLTNTSSIDRMVKKILQHTESRPELQFLLKRLGLHPEYKIPASERSFDDQRLIAQFFQTFGKHNTNFLSEFVGEKGYSEYVDSNTESLKDRIKEEWRQNFRQNLKSPAVNQEKLKGGIVEYDTDYFKKSFGVAGRGFDYKGFAGAIGVRFADEESYKDKVVIERLNYIYKDIISGKTSDVFDRAAGSNHTGRGGSIDQMVAIELKSRGDVIENTHRKMGGQPVYNNTLNSYLTLLLDGINEVLSVSAQELADMHSEGKIPSPTHRAYLLKEMEWLNGTFQNNSYWLQNNGLIFDNNGMVRPGASFTIENLEGVIVQDAFDSGTESDDLEAPDRLAQKINAVLRGKNPMVRPGDNSIERVINIGGKLVITPEMVMNKDSGLLYSIFKGYVIDEIARAMELHAGIGSDILNYNKIITKDKKGGITAINLGIFQDILTKDTIDKIVDFIQKTPLLYSDVNSLAPLQVEEFVNSLTELQGSIREYVNKQVRANKDSMVRNKLVDATSDGAIINNGIVPVQYVNSNGGVSTLTPDSIENLNRIVTLYTVNNLINNIEQYKIIFGDTMFYKSTAEIFKRTAMGISPKQVMDVSDDINEWMRLNFDRSDGKIPDGKLNVAVCSDPRARLSEDTLNEWIKILLTKEQLKEYKDGLKDDLYIGEDPMLKKLSEILQSYRGVVEADGQGWITLDEWREFMFRSSDLSPQQAALVDKFNTDPDYKPTLEEFIQGAYIQAAKPQYFGPVVSDSMFVPTGFKCGFLALIPSLTKGTQLDTIRRFARAKKVGVVICTSGNKVGTKLNPEGEVQRLYDKKGKIIDYTSKKLVITPTYYRFWGNQLHINPKPRATSITGTQVMKIVLSNLTRNGAARPMSFIKRIWDGEKFILERTDVSVDETQKILDRYLAIHAKLIQLGVEDLLSEMGLKKDKDGTYIVKDSTRLRETLRKEAMRRQLPSNVVDAIRDIIANVDIAANREKIENILFSIADARVFSRRRHGTEMFEASSTGFETSPRRYHRNSDTYVSGEIDTYRSVEGNVGTIDIYIPHYFRELLGQDVDITTLDGRLLNGVDFRIPTQDINSIDYATIKKFLPGESSRSVIISPGMINKSGTDLDGDELHLYLPNYFINKDRLPEYIDPDNWELQYNDYAGIQAERLTERLLGRIGGAVKTTYTMKVVDAALSKVDKSNLGDIDEILSYLEKELYNELTILYKDKSMRVSKQAAAAIQEEIDELEKAIVTLENIIESGDSEVDNPISMKQFERMALENEHITLMGEILTSPENFEQLITPNSTKQLEDNALYIRWLYSGKEGTFEAYKSALESEELPRRFAIESDYISSTDAFLSAKVGRGMSVTQSTSNILAQLHGLKIKGTLNLPHNNENGHIILGSDKDAAGENKITEVLSGFINAYVDATKNPFFKDINLLQRAATTHMFLTRAGVPELVVDLFMMQPIILDYIENLSIYGSNVAKANGIGRNIDVVRHTLAKYGERELPEYTRSEVSRGQLESNILESVTGKVSVSYNARQVKILSDYLKYQELSQYLLDSILATRYDTNAAGKNVSEMMLSLARTQQVLQDKVVAGYEKLLGFKYDDDGNLVTDEDSNTIMSPYYHFAKSLSKDVFRPFLLVLQDNEFKKLSYELLKLIKFGSYVNRAGKTIKIINKDEDVITALDKLKDFYITYLLITMHEPGKMPLKSEIDSLFRGENSLPQRIGRIKNDPTHPLYNNKAIQELYPIIASKDRDKGEIDNLKMFSTSYTTDGSDRLTNAFREITTYDPELGESLVKFAILQSGIGFSPITFLHYLPHEDFIRIAGPILSRVAVDKANGSISDEMYGSLARDFLRNNSNNNVLVPTIRRETDWLRYGSYFFVKTRNIKPEYANMAVADRRRLGRKAWETILYRREGNRWFPTHKLGKQDYANSSSIIEVDVIESSIRSNNTVERVMPVAQNVEHVPSAGVIATTTPRTSAPKERVEVVNTQVLSEIKDLPVYSDKGVNTLRSAKTQNYNFGNPFIGSVRQGVSDKIDNVTTFGTVKEASDAYRDWLLGTKHQTTNPEQRKWILEQIGSGRLDGKTLLYYKPSKVQQLNGTWVTDYYSHADVLAELVRSKKRSIEDIDKEIPIGEPTKLWKTEEEFNSLLERFFNNFGISFEKGESSVDILRRVAYVNPKTASKDFVDGSARLLTHLFLASPNIDHHYIEQLVEDTREFRDGINKVPDIKKIWEYLKTGERIPIEEWIPYIKEYDKVRDSVLEKYIKESLVEARGGTSNLSKYISQFLQWFKDLFRTAKNIKEVTDALVSQVLQNSKEIILGDSNINDKEKVTLKKALKETKHGEDIINLLGEAGLVLTGSISLSEQGTVYRKVGYLLHDIDWLVPFDFKGNPEGILKNKFKGTQMVREFDGPTYYTKTFIVPPVGHSVKNLTFFRSEEYGNRYIAGFDIVSNETGRIVSNYRRYYNVKPVSKKVVEDREVYNEGLSDVPRDLNGISVDLFYLREEEKFKHQTITLPSGVTLRIANWLGTFTEKLRYRRSKDLLDWANFIPIKSAASVYHAGDKSGINIDESALPRTGDWITEDNKGDNPIKKC